jgi:hypothetical protein
VDEQFSYNTINIMSLEFTPTPYIYLATITNNNTKDKQNIRWEVRFEFQSIKVLHLGKTQTSNFARIQVQPVYTILVMESNCIKHRKIE